MGNCLIKSKATTEQEAHHRKLTLLLKGDKKKFESEIKLLLLGAGESGKSTIAKQMKILHLDGYTDDEKKSFKSIIFNNVIGSMRTLIHACVELKISEISQPNTDAAKRMMENNPNIISGNLTKEIAADIEQLWGDVGIKEAFSRQSEFQLNDSAGYFFSQIKRLAASDYIPSEQDLLRSRAKTTGIIETHFTIENINFRMVDVGGQRSERKKWMHCFQDVTAVIFCVALSEYDQKLYEDDITNRMHESLKLFKEICNSKWFLNTSMILFLNKKDLFAEKITKVDLNVCFPDYKGGKNYDNSIKFITKKFLEQNETRDKLVYNHVTCATDTDNVRVVFSAVKDIVLQQALRDTGLTDPI